SRYRGEIDKVHVWYGVGMACSKGSGIGFYNTVCLVDRGGRLVVCGAGLWPSLPGFASQLGRLRNSCARAMARKRALEQPKACLPGCTATPAPPKPPATPPTPDRPLQNQRQQRLRPLQSKAGL